MSNLPKSQRRSPAALLINALQKNKISCKLKNFPVALLSATEDNKIHLSIFKFKCVSNTLLENTRFPLCFKFKEPTKQYICVIPTAYN